MKTAATALQLVAAFRLNVPWNAPMEFTVNDSVAARGEDVLCCWSVYPDAAVTIPE